MESRRPIEPIQSDQPTEPMNPVEPVEYREPVAPDRVVPNRVVTDREPVGYRAAVVRQPGVSPAYRWSHVVYLILGIVETLLVIRFILKLLAANPGAGFSSLIYNITDPLVALFQGVFPNAQARGSVVDLAAILAIIVYALVAWVIVRLIWITQRRQITPPA